MSDVTARAARLAELHEAPDTLVLPTVWDVWSARLADGAGFAALTVGSHPVAESLGAADGEGMRFDDYLAVARRIIAATELPVSVDVESGYGLGPRELAHRVLDAGIAGVNIEDTVHSEGGRIRSLAEHADYIAAVRAVADDAGVALVINGRTDALKHGTDAFADPLAEAEARSIAMVEAGARAVYPVRLPDADAVRRLVAAVPVPVNLTAHPVDGHAVGRLAEIRELGARRVTFGPLFQGALSSVAAEMLAGWRG